jgi:hypothetical protein
MGTAGAVVKDGEGDRRDHEDYCRPGSQPGEDIGRGARPEGGLRTLAAESTGEVGGTALLEQDDTDQKDTHENVDDDDKIEENLHDLEVCFLRAVRLCPVRPWCGGGDLNPYAG